MVVVLKTIFDFEQTSRNTGNLVFRKSSAKISFKMLFIAKIWKSIKNFKNYQRFWSWKLDTKIEQKIPLKLHRKISTFGIAFGKQKSSNWDFFQKVETSRHAWRWCFVGFWYQKFHFGWSGTTFVSFLWSRTWCREPSCKT